MNKQNFILDCFHAFNYRDKTIDKIIYEEDILERIYSLMNHLHNPVNIKNLTMDGEILVLHVKESLELNIDTTFYNTDLSIISEIKENESIIYIKRR